jgi:DNA-directed RNA polymerase subunit RPC12/RpoP
MGMRRTYFCDRCGGQIMFLPPVSMTLAVGVSLPGTLDLPGRFDLCDRCAEAFAEWTEEELGHKDMLDPGVPCRDCVTPNQGPYRHPFRGPMVREPCGKRP